MVPDLAGLADGMNLYAFVHNAPLRYVDPDGRFAFLIAPLLISLAIDFCLPTAAALTEQYAGGAIAAFAVGMVKGYQGDISLGDLNPASMGLHSAGMAIGGLIAFKDAPKKAVAGIGSKILSAEAWQAGKSLVTHTVSKVSQAFARNTATKTAQVAEKALMTGTKPGRIDAVIRETLSGTGDITSHLRLSSNEALDTGMKYLGKNYKELVRGSGKFRSADGLRQFRIDMNSLQGKHDPWVPHVHLEAFQPNTRFPYVNNHIFIYE